MASTQNPPEGDVVLHLASVLRAVESFFGHGLRDASSGSALRLLQTVAAEFAAAQTLLSNETLDGNTRARVGELVIALAESQARLRRHAVDLRFEALRRISASVERLRRSRTVGELVESLPFELCVSCGFDRACVSRIEGSAWTPLAVHIDPEAHADGGHRLRAGMRGMSIPLRPPLVEAEIVRRSAAILVSGSAVGSRTLPKLLDLTATDAYVVAPIIADGRVVGLLHADRVGHRHVDEADLENLKAFAEGVGLAVERAALRDRLAIQHRRATEALQSAAATIGDLAEASVELSHRRPRSTDVGMGALASSDADVSRSPGVHGLLTRRERDVLERLARGASNEQIADELVVAKSTVKSHVRHILRKLKASNRAEAVSRYLRLVDEDPEGRVA